MKKIQTITIGIILASVMSFVAITPSAYAADLKCSVLPDAICKKADNSGKVENTGVWALLIFILNILTALVGFVAVGMVAYAGVVYASAGEKADQVKKAKDIITNVLIGVALYGLMFILLNWLIPGGVLTT